MSDAVYSVNTNYEILGFVGTYYETYGGGPEGGFFFTNDKWYAVDRTWNEFWAMNECSPMTFTPEDRSKGIGAEICETKTYNKIQFIKEQQAKMKELCIKHGICETVMNLGVSCPVEDVLDAL